MSSVLRYVKANYPNIKIITGGANRSTWMPGIHFTGYSEDELVAWLFAQQKKSPPNVKFDITTSDHRFDDTDCISPNEVLPIELGRGCMFKCKFCNTPNKGKRKSTYQRNYQNILDEIQWNKEQFGVTRYNFLDDTVNEDPIKLLNLSKIKEHLGFGITWNGYIRADLIWSNQKTAEYLIDSGMRTCFMGIETFNKEAGDTIGKGWAPRHGKTFLPFLHDTLFDKRINLFCSYIVGLPGETEESLLDTYRWCSENDIGFHFMQKLAIMPGTELATGDFKYNKIKYPILNPPYEAYGSRNRLSGWDLFSFLGLGYDLEETRALAHHQLPKDDLNSRVEMFIETYFQKLLSL